MVISIVWIIGTSIGAFTASRFSNDLITVDIGALLGFIASSWINNWLIEKFTK